MTTHHPLRLGLHTYLPVRPWRVTTAIDNQSTTHKLMATTATHAIASALELGGKNCTMMQCLRENEWP